MPKEYDESTLKRLQQAELEILKDFMRLCDAHGLQYFGIAGTGIGALRHGGFIPWDDDIDVALPRADYEAFLSLAKQELAEQYIVLNVEENENYPLMTTRLMRKNTIFREEALKDINCPLGIFLDIYPFDNLSDDPKACKKQMRQAWLFSKLLILRSIPFPVLGFGGVKGKLVHAACAVAHAMLVLFRVPKRWLAGKCKEASTRFNHEETQRIDYLCDTTPTMNIYRRQDVFPLVKLPFEDTYLNFPNNMHDNLTGMYGDYMQLPPVEKRKNHYPYQLEFESHAEKVAVGE
ncbi:MAG TPA: LicD family protein [Candidatus Gallacutalibacter stercoravium]|nr:LicD family protein [Candidatus Gallacutalibacter stercoravium]